MMNRPCWRRIGGVLRCRLDVRIAIEREIRQEPEPRPRMTAEKVLDLFSQPDLPAGAEEVAHALSHGSFSE